MPCAMRARHCVPMRPQPPGANCSTRSPRRDSLTGGHRGAAAAAAATTIGLHAVAAISRPRRWATAARDAAVDGAFLVVLVAGEIGSTVPGAAPPRGLRLLLLGLALWLSLGVLRDSFLITVAPLAPVTAMLGALVFTIATGSSRRARLSCPAHGRAVGDLAGSPPQARGATAGQGGPLGAASPSVQPGPANRCLPQPDQGGTAADLRRPPAGCAGAGHQGHITGETSHGQFQMRRRGDRHLDGRCRCRRLRAAGRADGERACRRP